MNYPDPDDVDRSLIFEDVHEFIKKARYQYDLMQISTCMLAQALSIAKTCLNNEDFDKFAKYVYENRQRVKPYPIND